MAGRNGNTVMPGSGALQGEAERLRELGYPVPQAPMPAPPGSGTLPPGRGVWAVPSFESFAAIWNSVSRVYRYTYDEAIRDSRKNALAYYRDPVVWQALEARAMPVAGLEWHLRPANENDPGDADHAKRVREAIEETPNLQQLVMMLCRGSTWYGRYGAQILYDWDWSPGYRRIVVREFNPINGDKLVFRYSGEAGILVSGLWQGDWIPTDRGRCHIFSPDERQCVIIHRFEREDADFYEPEMAGRLEGVGVRDRLYWFLFMKSRVLAWLMEFLERVGAGGLTLYYYESGNDASKDEITEIARTQGVNNAILFPRYIDGKGGPGIERIEPSEAGAQILLTLVTDYFDAVVRRVILGQTLSSSAAGTGLGSGVADLHEETLNRIIKYDAVNLQQTLTDQFVRVISRHIDPSRRSPKWVYSVDKPDAAEHLQGAQAMFEMGADLDEDSLRDVLGLQKPKPGSLILSRYGPLGRQGATIQAQMGMMMAGMGPPAEGNQPGGISPSNQTVLPGNLIPGDPVAQPQSGAIDPLLMALFGGGVL